MAVDSIIANPTKSVRVMVAAASGCCASAVSAVATDRPSPKAGPIHPKLIVMPDVAIEATAITVGLSMLFLWLIQGLWCCFGLGFARARGGRDVDRGQDAEDVGLHHSGEFAEQCHDDGKEERRNRQQYTDDHRPAHHVAEKTHRQRQRPREFAD